MLLCPPATLIDRMAEKAAGSALQIGAQDCHAKAAGAHTGDISAAMLRDAGATWVILGHSERRQDHGETDALIRAKLETAHAHGLAVILCVGETRAERDAGRTLEVVRAQIEAALTRYHDATTDNLVIAYEPVWAIGTGLTPTLEQIAEVHGFMRALLSGNAGYFANSLIGPGIRLLYGGSVKAANAAEIFAVPHVNGALVGGASLRAADFGPIVAALEAAG